MLLRLTLPFLLNAVESLRVLDALEARETRLTVLMFAADDPTATASMRPPRATQRAAQLYLPFFPTLPRNSSPKHRKNCVRLTNVFACS